MKKKTVIILFAICIMSICFFSGLLVYAFEVQGDRNNMKDIIINKASILASNTLTRPSTQESKPAKPVKPVKPVKTEAVDQKKTKPIILDFAGDINFDESSKPMARYDEKKKGILGGLSSDLVKEMKTADVMMLNNEFSYSNRGIKTKNKSFTFRANPNRVKILKQMGVDIVSLANNHALDYGPDALTDTFQTLDKAGIDYIGAGNNITRAKAPVYLNLGDKKIAYVAASRVVFSTDWYATDTKLGMIGTYDPQLYIKSIKKAAANSDFVVAFLHWGVERNSYPESYQRSLARQYIDAGADLVVGCHPHVLQGFEFYKGKPIAYSLGNFWFGSSNQDSGLLKLYLNENNSIKLQILPAKAEDTYTYLLLDTTKKKQYYNNMEKLSYGVTIDKNGFIKEK